MLKWQTVSLSALVFIVLAIQLSEALEPISSTIATGAAIFASLGFGAYEFLKCNFHECCNKLWIKQEIDANELSETLRARLYGQHLAVSSVTKHVKAHLHNTSPSKALAMSMHGWTGTGKNFISQIVAEYVYKKGMNSAFVHLINCGRDYPHNTEEFIRKYKTQLKEKIESRISRCDRTLFIIDEVDHMPPGVMDVIKPYLEYYDKLDGVTYRRAMFFFLSNSGGAAITEVTLDFFRSGKNREDMTLKDLENTVSLAAFNADNKAGMWHSELITKHMVTAFVPFLPLEKPHVRKCTRDIMADKNFTKTEIDANIESVINELTFYPEDEQRFSTTGCKRVAEKIDFVMTEF